MSRISLNGVEMLFADAYWGDITVEETVNASGAIINGINECLIEVWKDPYQPFEKSAEFTAEIILEYEGSVPEEKPWWQFLLLPIGVGLASALMVGSAVALTRRRQK